MIYIYVDQFLGWHNNQYISVQVSAIKLYRFMATGDWDDVGISYFWKALFQIDCYDEAKFYTPYSDAKSQQDWE